MRYLSRTQNERCMYDIVLRDKSLAQCQRYRAIGIYCKQHAAKNPATTKPGEKK